mmetsp:Transcript_15122/g.39292  ORF Transcript_15122/g.39292 Transcript_15122/m.39292 type:complete len:126 (+) Transcript_15122:608-985(+)
MCAQSVDQAFAKSGYTDLSTKWSQMKGQCKSGDSKSLATTTKAFMESVADKLKSVQNLAAEGIFAKAEASAKTLGSRSARSPLRLAAYGCLAVGAVLLAAAAVVHVRSRGESNFNELQEKEAEML